ncbi:MAG: hypothetical protein QME75_07550 [Deltaproteobacteria bacterium]|nr:hypothetical protein [Deltaproteobacteria bacterium]
MTEGALLLVRLLAGLGALQLVGYGLTAWLCPAPEAFSRLERHAVGLGLGALIISLWMLALALLGSSFRLPLVLGPPLIPALSGIIWQALRRKGQTAVSALPEKTKNQKPKTKNLLSHWDWLLLGLLGVLFLFAALRAVLYPMWAWDALATWGFKAKVFYLEQGLDLSRIKAHNYYPNLVPLLLTYLYLCLGQVNDHLVKLVFPLFGAGLLSLVYSLLRRSGLGRTASLGITAFLALNGVTFIVHLFIAYADLPLTYYTLGAVGFTWMRLRQEGPSGCLPLAAAFTAGLAWCKFEGPPLAGTIILAAALALITLRPPSWPRCLPALAWPLGGVLLGYLPWRLFMRLHHIETGSDHLLGFYPQQLFQALPVVLKGLFFPKFFGVLWPAALASLVLLAKKPPAATISPSQAGPVPAHGGGLWLTARPLFAPPTLFLALFLGGNLVAILLGYAVAPTSAEEFPFYVRATLDRLLLHITPAAALIIGEGLRHLEARGSLE